VFEPPLPSANQSLKLRQLIAQIFAARAGNRVWLAADLSVNGANPAVLLQAGNRAIQGSRAKPDTGELLDIFHHGVPVLIAIGKARENE
jgi:hypothetical protein